MLKKYQILLYRIIAIFTVVFIFASRFYHLGNIKAVYFDELYHVPAAILSLNNDDRFYEWWHPAFVANEYEYEAGFGAGYDFFDWLHPPLAKYMQAFLMMIFGINSFGWRFGSALFGVLVIWATYLLAKTMFNKRVAILSAFLMSLEGLILVQSRIAMNDIYLVFFLLMAIYFYIKFKQHRSSNKFIFLTGLFVGLSIATKWSGIFLLIFILVCEFIALLKKLIEIKGKYNLVFIKQIPWKLFCLVLLPTAVYIFSFIQIFLQGKDIKFLIDLHKQIIWYQTHRDNLHAYASRPLDWFMNLRPVWYWQGNPKFKLFTSEIKTYQANIYALGNPVIFILGAAGVMNALAYVGFNLNQVQKNKHNVFFLLLLYLTMWVPWFFSPRVLFFFHYLPAVPLMIILLAFFIDKLLSNNDKVLNFIAYLMLGLSALAFIVFYPHWTGIYLPKKYINSVYFTISSWR